MVLYCAKALPGLKKNLLIHNLQGHIHLESLESKIPQKINVIIKLQLKNGARTIFQEGSP